MVAVVGLLALWLPGASSADQPIDSALYAVVQRTSPTSLQTYRLPERRDLTGDWELQPEAWRARADFNGDGVEDVALLLLRRQGVGFQLLMLLAATGAAQGIVLEERPWAAQGFGLGVAAPGRYTTAAGKGYSVECDDDPDEITLRFPAVGRFHFESWSAFWYWDATLKRFRYVQMSD
jgi:hypothetical protein